MPRSDDRPFPWLGLGLLAVAVVVALLCLKFTLDRPAWSPDPRVRPASATIEGAGADGPPDEARSEGRWTIDVSTGRLRMIYRP